MSKPTIPEVLPVVLSLYKKESAGCCWHVVLDDGNTESCFVQTTANKLIESPCKNDECNRLAVMLPFMSRTQITKLYKTHQ